MIFTNKRSLGSVILSKHVKGPENYGTENYSLGPRTELWRTENYSLARAGALEASPQRGPERSGAAPLPAFCVTAGFLCCCCCSLVLLDFRPYETSWLFSAVDMYLYLFFPLLLVPSCILCFCLGPSPCCPPDPFGVARRADALVMGLWFCLLADDFTLLHFLKGSWRL